MIRPSQVLLTFLLVSLGLATAAEAAEGLSYLFAQAAPAAPSAPALQRGPGMYLNLFKFIPVLLIYLIWVWTTDWVEHDTQDLNNLKFGTWNSVVFFSGVLGLILVLAAADLRPGRDAALAGLFHPAAHLRLRPQPDGVRRTEGPDALSPGRGGQRPDHEAGDAAALQQGCRLDRPHRAADPVHRQEPGLGQGGPDAGQPGRGVAVVHGGQGAGVRRRAPPRHRHPPRADHRAALGPVPDRRHPARRRAVRPARPATPW